MLHLYMCETHFCTWLIRERKWRGRCLICLLIIVLFLVRGCRPGKSVSMSEQEVRGLCLKSREIFLQQPILLELEAPLKICGMYMRCPYRAFCILLETNVRYLRTNLTALSSIRWHSFVGVIEEYFEIIFELVWLLLNVWVKNSFSAISYWRR